MATNTEPADRAKLGKSGPSAKGTAAATTPTGASTATAAIAGTPAEGSLLLTRVDLNETMKALVHLAHENGYLSYDDINDLLPSRAHWMPQSRTA